MAVTSRTFRNMGITHAKLDAQPLTDEQIKGVTEAFMMHATFTESLLSNITAYTEGYVETMRAIRDARKVLRQVDVCPYCGSGHPHQGPTGC